MAATTFSSNYQIKLIGTGLESGTWGSSTNENFKRLEQSLGQPVSIDPIGASVPGGSSGATTDGLTPMKWVTLNSADAGESSSKGRARFVEFKNAGTTLTATIKVEIYGDNTSSLVDRIYVVKNNLTQDQSLELGIGVGDVYTLRNGAYAFVSVCQSSSIGGISQGINNLLSKLQIDNLVFPDSESATVTIADDEAAALTITNGTDTFLTFDSTTDGDKIDVAVPLNSSGSLQIDATTSVDINSPLIDLETQATSVKLKETDTAALEILQGADSYLKFNTSGGVILAGDSAAADEFEFRTSLITIDQQGTDLQIKNNQADALDIKTGSGSFILFDTLSTEGGEKTLRLGDVANVVGSGDEGAPMRLDVEIPDTTFASQASTITMKNADASALVFRDAAAAAFLTFDTDGEKITFGKPLDGADLRLEGSSSVVIDSPKLDLDDQDVAVTIKSSSANSLKFGLDGGQQLLVLDTAATPPEVEIPSGAKLNVVGASAFADIDIDGGNIDNTVIGDATAAAGTFTALTADTSFISDSVDIGGGDIDDTAIGVAVASSGKFTTLQATGVLTASSTSTFTGVATFDNNIDVSAQAAAQVLLNTNKSSALSIVDEDGGDNVYLTTDTVADELVLGDAIVATKVALSLELATGATVTGIDNGGALGSSSTLLATQGAIKTYVDAHDATGSALDDTKIWIGSASNVAAEFALSGDATMTAGGVVTVTAAAGTLTGTELKSTVVTSSLTTVGAISSGTWGGTTVAVNKGGTGATSLTNHGVLLGSGTGAVTVTSALGDGEILIGDGAGDPTTLDVGSSTEIKTLGTVTTGVWNGTAITGDYIDVTSSPLDDTKIWIGNASGDAAEFALSGNATMTAGGVVTVSTAAACSGNAATASEVSISASSLNATNYLAFVDSSTGTDHIGINTGLTFNPADVELKMTDPLGPTTIISGGSCISWTVQGFISVQAAQLQLGISGSSDTLTLKAPTTNDEYTVIFPSDAGSDGDYLKIATSTGGIVTLEWSAT